MTHRIADCSVVCAAHPFQVMSVPSALRVVAALVVLACAVEAASPRAPRGFTMPNVSFAQQQAKMQDSPHLNIFIIPHTHGMDLCGFICRRVFV